MNKITKIIILAFLVFGFILPTLSLDASTRSTIEFKSGIVDQDGTPLSDGIYNFGFIIFNQSTGGSSLWSENWSSVEVRRGQVSVDLGSINPFPDSLFANDSLYLQVCLNANGIAGDGSGSCGGNYEESFSPRKAITAVAWSYRANTLSSVDIAKDETAYNLNIYGDSGTLLNLNFNSTSQFNIGSAGSLSLGTGNSSFLFSPTSNSINLTGTTDIYFGANASLRNNSSSENSGANIIGVYTEGLQNITGNTLQKVIENIDGLFKWKPGTSSSISYSGGNVGIGTTTPNYLLDVNGTGSFSGGLKIGNTTTGVAGMLRWNGSDFEGYNGSSWNSLTSGGGGGSPSGSDGYIQFYSSGSFGSSANLNWNIANSYLTIGSSAGTSGILNLGPATTTRSSLNLANSSGVNVSSPTSGDLWWNGTNLYFYNGSSNVDLLASGGGSCATCFHQSGDAFGTTATLGTTDSNTLSIITNNTPAITILSDGKVGIGVSPTVKLDVAGAVTLTGVLTTGSSAISLTLATGYIDANAITLSGSTLDVTSNGLKVADGGITGTQLNSSVAGTGLTGGGGSALSVLYGSSAGNAVQGNTSITVSAGSGLGGGGSITLGSGGTVTLNNAGVTAFNTFTGGITLNGTTNQVNIDNNSGTITLSTPQDIDSSATPTFAGVLLSGLSASSAVYTDGLKNLTTTAPTTGAIGYLSRTGTTLSPATAGDNFTTSGDISTSGSGTITSTGLLTGNSGLTVLGTTSINASGIGTTTIGSGSGTVTIADGTGNLNLGNSSGTFSLTSNGGLNVTTGGNITAGTYNGNTLTSTALTFSGSNPNISPSTGNTGITINANGSGTIGIGATSTGDILLGGGSGSTGCTIENSTGNLTCSGTISGSNTTNYWSRVVTTLSPATAGDDITTAGNIYTSSSGTITSDGLITGNSGLTILGTTSINASGTGTTTIGSGSGIVTIANGTGNLALGNSTGTFSLTSNGGLNVTSGGVLMGATGINTTDATSLAIGNATGTFSLTSNGGLNVSTGGALTGVVSINSTDTSDLDIGNSSGTLTLTSNGGLNVTSGGALTGVASINTITTTSSALTFAGAGTISASSTGLDIQSDGSIDVNIAGGSGSTGCTIENSTGNLICSGTVSGTNITSNYWSRSVTTLSPVNVGDNITTSGSGTITSAGLLTGSNGITVTGGDANINASGTSNTSIGNGSGTFDITSNGGLNVNTTGDLTGVASIDTITTTATSLGFAGTGTISSGAGTDLNITSGTTGILNLDSGSTGAINIGTSSNAKTITVGNSTGATGLVFNSGTAGISSTSTATSGNAFSYTANSLSSGNGLYVTSTAASFSGSLAKIFWNPTSGSTATGDLFTIDTAGGSVLGNLFNVKDGGSSLFSVSQTQVTSTIPVQFNAPGDATFAYDLVLTNTTASFVKSDSNLNLQAGEVFNSSNLTLSTFNSGMIVLDTATVYTTGNVGIGTTPSYKLDVLASGTGVIARFNSANTTGCTLATGGTISCSSDVKLKQDIADINYGIDTVMQLRPVSFNWRNQDNPYKSLGFIAQDVNSILPNLVTVDSASGNMELNSIGFIPILTKAIQDQQEEITAMQSVLGISTNGSAAHILTQENILSYLNNTIIPSFKVKKITINEQLIAQSVIVIGDTQFYGQADFNNNVNVKDKISLGKNGAGKVTIKSGATKVSVKFNSAYNQTPIVSVSPNNILPSGTNYAVTNISKSGFDIEISYSTNSDIEFSWIAVGTTIDLPVSYSSN